MSACQRVIDAYGSSSLLHDNSFEDRVILLQVDQTAIPFSNEAVKRKERVMDICILNTTIC
jgi:hypothetical protein